MNVKVIGCLLAVMVWISGQCCTENGETAKMVANHRRITLEGMCEESEEAESESQKVTETEWESELQKTTETEWESESLLPPASETEKVLQICVTDIWPAYEDGYKVYDGSDYVELEADVTGLLEGMHLEVWGVAEQAEVGCWKVDTQMRFWVDPAIEGELPDYEVFMEDSELTITILPRPLTVTVSDGVKYYYEEPDLNRVEFFNVEEPIQVTGFVDDAIPKGFVMPELMLDSTVIRKESPMYQNGERIEYEAAVVVRTDEQGRPSGNATKNYCFILEKDSGYYEPGSIFLKEPPILGTLNYHIHAEPEDGMFCDTQGVVWVRKGTILSMKPEQGNGFHYGTGTQELGQSGTGAFQLFCTDKRGEITAASQPQYIAWQVDSEAPQTKLGVDGEDTVTGKTIYKKHPVTCGVLELWDTGCGIRSVQICTVGGESGICSNPEDIYRDYPQLWQPGIQIHLSEEGTYTVMLRVEDQVGNVRFVKSGQIVLDFMTPELEIQGILPGSANNGTVAPLVFCQDEYYEEGSLTVILEGSKVGKKRFSQERTGDVYGEQVQIHDIPWEKRWDDLYVLHAKASDRAGNVVEKKVTFSVNRFGSVYWLEEKTTDLLKMYYIKEPAELAIWEFNVDTVMNEKIRIGHGTQVKQLKSGTQYRVSQRTDSGGRNEYCYRISAENFQEEGVYYVTLSTVDRAENKTDNQLQNLKIEFAVDRTAPVIYISGVEDKAEYEEKQRVAVISCQDNQRLEKIQIYLNGKLIAENREEQQNIEIPEIDKWQYLEVKATDGAGNISVSEPLTFFIGEKSVSQEINTDVETEKAEVPKTQMKAVLETKEKENSGKQREMGNGIQAIIFLGLSGIFGGCLYHILRGNSHVS